jgi:hypothetical protein
MFESMTTTRESDKDLPGWVKDDEFNWFLRFLKARFCLLRKALGEDEQDGTDEAIKVINSMEELEILRKLAEILSSSSQLPPLETLRLRLQSETFLRLFHSIDDQHQVIFTMIGWLFMIYQPSLRFLEYSRRPALAIELQDFEGGPIQTDVYRSRSVRLGKGRTTKGPLHHV